jgi:hypothetical protein
MRESIHEQLLLYLIFGIAFENLIKTPIYINIRRFKDIN